MANITYLLGAGASFNAVPIVSHMTDEINATVQWIYQANGRIDQSNWDYRPFIERLGRLAVLCRSDHNFSIDTYAKKLIYAKKLKEYKELKEIVTLYFLLQQKRKGVDLRYDNFWASILTSDKLPSNIKIVSWNYDYQLELSYQDFFNSRSLRESSLNINLKDPSFEPHSNLNNDFAIFKLNGSATIKKPDQKDVDYLIDQMKVIDEKEFFKHFAALVNFTNEGYESMISFSWEENHSESFRNQLANSIRETEALVVIGYSFPFFNRETDKIILSRESMPRLKRIYIQDPKSNSLKTRIKGLMEPETPVIVESITETDQFFLPYEL